MTKRSKYPHSPNILVYTIAYPFLLLFTQLFMGLKWDKSAIRGMKGPFVVLCNHTSNVDYIIAGVTMFPYRMNYLAGAFLFRNKFSRWVMNLMGAIKKEQFISDPGAIRGMVKVARKGGVLAVWPAGQSTYSGSDTFMPRGIGRLLKLLDIPVVYLKTEGAHMMLPKWDRSKFRKTKIYTTVFPLYTQEYIRSTSVEQLEERVTQDLAFDDYEWQRKAKLPTRKPRSAKHLERLLYACPRCLLSPAMQTQGNRIFCEACGNAAYMDHYGFLNAENEDSLIFDTPPKWNDFQIGELKSALANDLGYHLKSRCTLYKVTNAKYVQVGEGDMELNRSGFFFNGTNAGENVSWHFTSDTRPIFPHEKQISFDIFTDHGIYSFAPEDYRLVNKYVQLEELLYLEKQGVKN